MKGGLAMSAATTGPTPEDDKEKGKNDETVNKAAIEGIRSAFNKTKSVGSSMILGVITGASRKVGEHLMEKLLDQ